MTVTQALEQKVILCPATKARIPGVLEEKQQKGTDQGQAKWKQTIKIQAD